MLFIFIVYVLTFFNVADIFYVNFFSFKVYLFKKSDYKSFSSVNRFNSSARKVSALSIIFFTVLPLIFKSGNFKLVFNLC